MVQNSSNMGHKKSHDPMSSGASKRSVAHVPIEQCKATSVKRAVPSKLRSERKKRTSEQMSEWHSTFVPITGLSKPPWNRDGVGLEAESRKCR